MSPSFGLWKGERAMERGPALQPRLRAIADLVPDGSLLADIGTDHGYIPVSLLLEGRIRHAVASDIGAEPLEHARRTARKWDVEHGIDFRLCDGLAGFRHHEADTIVIAGMGGDNIATILSAAPWATGGELLLLQPMSKAEVLRTWLPRNGYRIEAEQLVADKGVLYPILSVRGGEMSLATEAQAWGGFLLGNDPLWGRYLEERILRLRKAAAGLERARDPSLREKREDFLRVAAELETWKGEWQIADRTGD